MESIVLKKKQTPIEIALDIDETGHTTARKLYAWLELDKSQYARWVRTNIAENPYAEEGTEYSTLMSKTYLSGDRSRAIAMQLAMGPYACGKVI